MAYVGAGFFSAKQSSSLSKYSSSSSYLLVIKASFFASHFERSLTHCTRAGSVRACRFSVVSQQDLCRSGSSVFSVVCVCARTHGTAVGQLFTALLRVQSCQKLIKTSVYASSSPPPPFSYPIPLPLSLITPPTHLSLLQTQCGALSLLKDDSNNVSGFPWALPPLRNHSELAFAFVFFFFIRFKHNHRWQSCVSGFHLNVLILLPQ